MGIFKKAWNFITRPIKAIVDPVFDLVTNTFKAIVSPFTGGYDMPDYAIDYSSTSDEIKATTTVNFNAANRAMPVLYGNNVSVGTIPVFVGTFGDDSADTTKQYLYMAAVISQGFHGAATVTHQETFVPPPFSSATLHTAIYGSLLSRIVIDGKPVHLDVGTQTLHNNYSDGYDGSTAFSQTTTVDGVRSYGIGGVQPPIYNVTKGTFASRLSFQYFDGSADQPASSLLRQHPDWNDDQNTLSGVHYLAMRFLIQAADVTVGAGDGSGTYGNPYSGVPAVVVTTSGKSIPNITVGSGGAPGWAEKFQTSFSEPEISDVDRSYHKPLGIPDADGIIGGVDNVAKQILAIDSDTVIEFAGHQDFQSETYSSTGATQTFNIHNYLFNLGWTYDFVFFIPSYYRYNSDSSSYAPSYNDGDRGQWLKHVGAGHYKFLYKNEQTISTTISGGELTFFAYDSTLTESIINGVSPSGVVGDSTNDMSEYTFFHSDTSQIDLRVGNANYTVKLRIRNRSTGLNEVFDVLETNYAIIDSVGSSADLDIPYITLGIRNEDSSAVSETYYTTVPINSDVYVEITQLDWRPTSDKRPANFELHKEQGYIIDGLSYQGYFPDGNPVEYLLDYMLNPNYGMGLTFNEIDRESFINASIAGDMIPNYYDFDATVHYMGGDFLDATGRNEYMYGPNASPGNINGGQFQISNNSLDRQFVIDTSKTHLANVNLILASMGAIMPQVEGKFKLILENAGIPDNSEHIPPITALPITAHIKDEHIIDSIAINTATLNDKFNQIKIDYTDLRNNSQPNSVMSPDAVDDSTDIRTNYLAEDNNKSLEGTFSFPGIYDSVTAKKMATLLLKKSRGQPILNFSVSQIALNCLPGDFIRLESDAMKINDVYRVTNTNLNADNTLAMSCIRHIPAFYDVTDQGQIFEARRNIMDIK